MCSAFLLLNRESSTVTCRSAADDPLSPSRKPCRCGETCWCPSYSTSDSCGGCDQSLKRIKGERSHFSSRLAPETSVGVARAQWTDGRTNGWQAKTGRVFLQSCFLEITCWMQEQRSLNKQERRTPSYRAISRITSLHEKHIHTYAVQLTLYDHTYNRLSKLQANFNY